MKSYTVAKISLTHKVDEAELNVQCVALSRERGVRKADHYSVSAYGSLNGLSELKERLEKSKTMMVDAVSIYTKVGDNVFEYPARKVTFERMMEREVAQP